MVVVAAGTGGAHKVLLISGKQTGSSSGSQAGYSRPISVVLPSAASPASSDSDSNSSAGPPIRKRQRLTHLSPEEKALRRLVLENTFTIICGCKDSFKNKKRSINTAIVPGVTAGTRPKILILFLTM